MSDDATPRLALPYLAAGQAQKHVTLNEALARLDALVQTAVASRSTDAQPASPADGDLYIMTATPGGADWSGEDEGAVMRFEAGAWARLEMATGAVAWVADEALAVAFDGAGWVPLAGVPTALQDMDLLGVNATADATNRLAVASDAVLFSHDGDDARVKVNKAAAGDTASHLFQTGFSGRAEFGLTGSDDFAIKVSPDGSAWHDVMSFDRATGKATFALPAERPAQADVFTASGTYAVPAWARRLLLVVMGGGGGGGSGSAGTSAAAREGGGAGGAGGRAEEWFDVSEVASSLTVTVGAGGAGGTGVTGAATGANGATGGTSSVASSGAVILEAGGGQRGFADGSGGFGNRGDFGFGNGGGVGSPSGNGGSGLPTGSLTLPAFVHAAAAGGGGGGGGLGVAGTSTTGGAGGDGYWKGGAGRKAVGGAASSAGGAGLAGTAKAWTRGAGGGGGGGGGTASAGGGAGGAGGAPSAGGGGGGACRDTSTSGAGGAGARGEIMIVAYG